MNLELWKKQKKELHLNYYEISERSGVPLTTVKNIFCGYVTAPRIDTVEAIERAFDLALTPEERAAGASETRKISITPIEDEMLYLFRELGYKHGEDAQRAILTVVEKMLK